MIDLGLSGASARRSWLVRWNEADLPVTTFRFNVKLQGARLVGSQRLRSKVTAMLASATSANTSRANIPLHASQGAPLAATGRAAALEADPLTFHFELRPPTRHDGVVPLHPSSDGIGRFVRGAINPAEQPEAFQLLREFRRLLSASPPDVARVFMELFRPHELEWLASNPHLHAAFNSHGGTFLDVLEAARAQPIPDERLEEWLQDIVASTNAPESLMREAGDHSQLTAVRADLLTRDPRVRNLRDALCATACFLIPVAGFISVSHTFLALAQEGASASTESRVASQCGLGALNLALALCVLCQFRIGYQRSAQLRSAATAQAAIQLHATASDQARQAAQSGTLALNRHRVSHDYGDAHVVNIPVIDPQDRDATIAGLDEPDPIYDVSTSSTTPSGNATDPRT